MLNVLQNSSTLGENTAIALDGDDLGFPRRNDRRPGLPSVDPGSPPISPTPRSPFSN
ncbi:hypothetical protein [Neosynechococcus sphagnicola]|uniref:hypothetical protein n=1 Tax=Neosynechococcus sphagnicola TaxID=1501145 RepID=UPI0012E09F2E|nr:hypothetical protein [Neosynechococcus sphagnicola]